MSNNNQKNLDVKTVQDFGKEWKYFNQNALQTNEAHAIFSSYFKIFPMETLNENSVGIDIGCGSGRWAKLIAPVVKKLYCLDASHEALMVAKRNLLEESNVEFIHASVDQIPLSDDSLDFAYSLGVLHHIPDTAAGINASVKKLKSGAPFLAYLYYAFDNKPRWFCLLWKISDYFRQIISKLPFRSKLLTSKLIAGIVYFPLARFAYLLDKLKFNVSNFPLSSYRERSFYTMCTDALDRFGTRLEKRFSQQEIIQMLQKAGLEKIKISTEPPYWCVVGYKTKHSIKN